MVPADAAIVPDERDDTAGMLRVFLITSPETAAFSACAYPESHRTDENRTRRFKINKTLPCRVMSTVCVV
jgi:hypothetical protein